MLAVVLPWMFILAVAMVMAMPVAFLPLSSLLAEHEEGEIRSSLRHALPKRSLVGPLNLEPHEHETLYYGELL